MNSTLTSFFSTFRPSPVVLVLRALYILILSATANQASAQWPRSSNLQLLQGSGYELGADKRTIATYEQINISDRGDFFLFADISRPSSGNGTTAYGEATLRIKLPPIQSAPSRIKNLYAASAIELGDEVHAYLIGLGSSLDVPGFDFFNLNLLLRKSYRDFVNKDTDVGGQLNINWRYPFGFAGGDWVFEGHLDFAFAEDGGDRPKHDNVNSAPRLLLDVGRSFGKPNQLYAGVEYQFWRHKFGVKGVDEGVAQAMVKWVF